MDIGYLMSPVLPQRRTCPCAGGQMLSLQGPLSIAALPGHILPSKGRLSSNHAQRCSYPSNDHQRCPTGDLAPIPRNSCCPSKAECDNTNCSQVIFHTLAKKKFQICELQILFCCRFAALLSAAVTAQLLRFPKASVALARELALLRWSKFVSRYLEFWMFKMFNIQYHCRHILWNRATARDQTAPRLPATWQGENLWDKYLYGQSYLARWTNHDESIIRA